jgi:hypothetical protein
MRVCLAAMLNNVTGPEIGRLVVNLGSPHLCARRRPVRILRVLVRLRCLLAGQGNILRRRPPFLDTLPFHLLRPNTASPARC